MPIFGLHVGGVDKQFHAQVAVEFTIAFGFGETAHRVKVVDLDAIEIIFGLRIESAEDSVGVCFPINMRDTPGVALNRHIGCTGLPACQLS